MWQEIGVQFLRNVLGAISLDNYQAYGHFLGNLLWNFLPERKKYTISSLQKHLSVDYVQAKRLAKSNFLHTGTSFLESLLVQRLDYRYLQPKITLNDPALVEQLAKTSRPVVVTTAHLGPWELLLAVLKFYFPDKPTQVIVKFPKNKFLAQLILACRKQRNVEIIGHRQASSKVIPHLRRGGLAAFLVDHNTLRKEAIFLPFLGELAAVNLGPALLAIRTKALVYPAFVLRTNDFKIKLILKKPLDTRKLKGNFQEKLFTVAKFYTRAVEEQVLKRPEQWYWLHKRWKTRP